MRPPSHHFFTIAPRGLWSMGFTWLLETHMHQRSCYTFTIDVKLVGQREPPHGPIIMVESWFQTRVCRAGALGSRACAARTWRHRTLTVRGNSEQASSWQHRGPWRLLCDPSWRSSMYRQSCLCTVCVMIESRCVVDIGVRVCICSRVNVYALTAC